MYEKILRKCFINSYRETLCLIFFHEVQHLLAITVVQWVQWQESIINHFCQRTLKKGKIILSNIGLNTLSLFNCGSINSEVCFFFYYLQTFIVSILYECYIHGCNVQNWVHCPSVGSYELKKANFTFRLFFF